MNGSNPMPRCCSLVFGERRLAGIASSRDLSVFIKVGIRGQPANKISEDSRRIIVYPPRFHVDMYALALEFFDVCIISFLTPVSYFLPASRFLNNGQLCLDSIPP